MTTTWYGACGVEFCADCLPIYNEANEPIGDVPPQPSNSSTSPVQPAQPGADQ